MKKENMMASKVRVKRPLKFKLDAYRLYAYGNMPPKEAFAEAARLNNTTLSGCMTDYASSYMSDDVKNWLRKKIQAHRAGQSVSPEIIDYFNAHNMAFDF